MSDVPREDAQAYWEAFAGGRQSADEASTASLALYGCSPLYDAYRHRCECIAVASLLGRPSPQWRVLDIGCGPGRWTLPFAQTCAAVTAIDFSENMLAHAKRRCEEAGVAGRVTFRQQRLEEVDAKSFDQPFDLVLVMGVLQFFALPELGGITERIANCVKPGGLLMHRETRSPQPWEKTYSPTDGAIMKSYYKPFEVYREAFSRQQLTVKGRRSIIPPSLLYSLYSRIFPPDQRDPLGGLPLKAILASHEWLVDPLWRCAPELLWRVNSRRLTDQTAVLYGKA